MVKQKGTIYTDLELSRDLLIENIHRLKSIKNKGDTEHGDKI